MIFKDVKLVTLKVLSVTAMMTTGFLWYLKKNLKDQSNAWQVLIYRPGNDTVTSKSMEVNKSPLGNKLKLLYGFIH